MGGDTYFIAQLNEAKLGLKFNGVEITDVVSDSWADRAGVEVDDEFVTVNGQLFKDMNNEERLSALVNAQRPVEIKFKRPIIKDLYFVCTLHDRKIGMTMKGKYVKTVGDGGWADKQGIQIGDEIAELAEQGYGGLTDEERLKIFAGGRPLKIKFVRRNQKTAAALKREKKSEELSAEMSKWSILKSQNTRGFDPTQENATVSDLTHAANMNRNNNNRGGFKSGSSSSGWCVCCDNHADRSNELTVGN